MLRGAIRRGAFPQHGHVFVFIPVFTASHFVDEGGRATVRPIALPRNVLPFPLSMHLTEICATAAKRALKAAARR